MDNKRTGMFLMIALIAYIVWFAVSFNYFADLMTSSGVFVGLLIYYLSSPAYVMLVFFSTKYLSENKLKGFISGIALILCFDIISFPRLSSNAMDVGTSAMTNGDTIIIGSLTSAGLSYTASWWVYYLVIPCLLVIAAAFLLGFANFHKKITNGGA